MFCCLFYDIILCKIVKIKIIFKAELVFKPNNSKTWNISKIPYREKANFSEKYAFISQCLSRLKWAIPISFSTVDYIGIMGELFFVF